MRIELRTNAAQVSRTLMLIFRDQVPFAASKAINDVLKQAQRAQQSSMSREFTIRRRVFMERSVKIKPFATKKTLQGTIRIEPPGGRERAAIWTRHELRGRRVPVEGRTLAVPIKARPSKLALVKKGMRPAAFAFKRVATRARTEIYKGRKRTFMIRKADGSGVILQRRRRGRSGTFVGARLLYRLVPSVPIEPRLQFRDTIDRVVRQRFAPAFRRAFLEAIRTAK